MSGSIGANRISREDVKPTVEQYENNVLKRFIGYKKCAITGSYNAGTKKDHGDIDLVVWIDSDEDLKTIKKNFKNLLDSLDDSVTPKFLNGNNKGKKSQMYGNIVTCQTQICGKNEYVQIDNVIVKSPQEMHFCKSFLNLDAQVQTLETAIVRVAQEETKKLAFEHFAIKNLPVLNINQEFEFALSMSGLSLRKVTLDDEKKTIAKEELWRNTNWENVVWLITEILGESPLWKSYEELLNITAKTFENDERARKRICGIMSSMINIGPGEIGKPKGIAKENGIKLARDILKI